jgi:VIT1/CCC1 family predicted Fe2+/Mn2+ transporter
MRVLTPSGFISREEEKNVHPLREIWAAAATFISKFFMAVTFLVPVLFCELATAIVVSVGWGLGVITLLSYQVAQSQGARPRRVIREHLVIFGGHSDPPAW